MSERSLSSRNLLSSTGSVSTTTNTLVYTSESYGMAKLKTPTRTFTCLLLSSLVFILFGLLLQGKLLNGTLAATTTSVAKPTAACDDHYNSNVPPFSRPQLIKSRKAVSPVALLPAQTQNRSQPVRRPEQTVASSSFWNSMQDAETFYYQSHPEITKKWREKCRNWGGMGLMEELLSSKSSLIQQDDEDNGNNGAELLEYYSTASGFGFFVAQAAVLKVESFSDPSKNPIVNIMVVDDDDDDTRKRSIVKPFRRISSVLGDASARLELTKSSTINKHTCTHTIDNPAMLIDNGVSHWNWWFFHKELMELFVIYSIIQPQLTANASAPSLQLFPVINDREFNRPMTDALELLLTDDRARYDSVQLWNTGRNETTTYCFQNHLIWSPGGYPGTESLLINKVHQHMRCFSAIVTAYAAHLKASLHIPALPANHRNGKNSMPRILWVARDTNLAANPSQWQIKRIINNQDELTAYLQNQCLKLGIEMSVAKFYGPFGSQTSFREQAHAAARTDILIGIHGAGLNLDMFMPFNSVVAEIHLGTSAQMNSANAIAHFGTGLYIPHDGVWKSVLNRELDQENIWLLLKRAIKSWKDLHTE